MSGMAVLPPHAPASGVTSRLKGRSTASAGDDDLRHRFRSLPPGKPVNEVFGGFRLWFGSEAWSYHDPTSIGTFPWPSGPSRRGVRVRSRRPEGPEPFPGLRLYRHGGRALEPGVGQHQAL